MSLKYVDLPLFSDSYYEYSISLQGVSYVLEFVYNERMSLYIFNLYDAESNPIVLGQALVPTFPILKDYAIENLTGFFWMEEKADIVHQPYKEYPDKIDKYYNFYYIYEDGV
jgi:hypothetical protein